MFEITPQLQELYRDYEGSTDWRDNKIADALRDAVAAWLYEAWCRWTDEDHGDWLYGDYWEKKNWTPKQWQALAHRLLMGE